MFAKSSPLTSLNLYNFNTNNVKDMNEMFSYCSSFEDLDLSYFNTINVEYMLNLFLNINKNCLLKCKDPNIFNKYKNILYIIY